MHLITERDAAALLHTTRHGIDRLVAQKALRRYTGPDGEPLYLWDEVEQRRSGTGRGRAVASLSGAPRPVSNTRGAVGWSLLWVTLLVVLVFGPWGFRWIG